MKVLHLSTYDIQGGAARASYRLHEGLQRIQVDSRMMVQTQTSDNPYVISPKGDFRKNCSKLLPAISKIPVLRYPNRQNRMFSPQWLPDDIIPSIQELSPNIINLNWVCDGFIQIETLAKLRIPLVWTLMDEWSFTGGCHYTGQGLDFLPCDRYQESCGKCPQLNSQQQKDLSYRVWKRKQLAYSKIQITIVSPSQWLANQASKSSLLRRFPIHIIPYGLDIECYSPRDPNILRELLDLPQDKLLVAFGAFEATRDPRKGWEVLQSALHYLAKTEWKDRIHLVVFGASQGDGISDFPTHFLGNIQDDRLLAFIYGSVDVMVVPSIQEAFGQTASEAMACGTPVVAFKKTGVDSIIDHFENGYLAEAYDAEDLARGITWVLSDPLRRSQLAQAARLKAEISFSWISQAQAYRSLFEDLLENRSAK